MINLTSSQLRQAADLIDQIAALEAQLAGLLGGTSPAPSEASTAVQTPEPVEPAKPGRRTMSPAHKAKIRAAQALRWAKFHAAKGKPAEAKKPGKKKGGMSAEGRARIITAQKLRWAKVKAAKSEESAKSEGKPIRKMSAAGRAAIAAAARARWAKYNAAKK